MPTRVCVVEDEPLSRERLVKLLRGFDDVVVDVEAADGVSAVAMIEARKPDAVFLDIQLPELSGFEVLARLSHRPAVIFVTAFDEYAVRAFDERAVDYLLKPVAESRLARAVGRLREGGRSVDASLLRLLQEAVRPGRFPERLAVRQHQTVIFVPVREIRWMEADDRYIVLHTGDQEYLYDGALKDLEAQLDPDQFCRIHRSVIVATGHIREVTCRLGGRYAVKLSGQGGPILPVGRGYLSLVRARLRF
jgi:two-component system, LytTR family, response regulator